MSKWDKLITRICNLSKDLRFDELRKVLESYGYEMNAPRSGSSHYTFRKQGCMPITIPKHEPIKKVYVEMVRHANYAQTECQFRYCGTAIPFLTVRSTAR